MQSRAFRTMLRPLQVNGLRELRLFEQEPGEGKERKSRKEAPQRSGNTHVFVALQADAPARVLHDIFG